MTEFKATVKTENSKVELTGLEASSPSEARTEARWEALENHFEDGVEISEIVVEEM